MSLRRVFAKGRHTASTFARPTLFAPSAPHASYIPHSVKHVYFGRKASSSARSASVTPSEAVRQYAEQLRLAVVKRETHPLAPLRNFKEQIQALGVVEDSVFAQEIIQKSISDVLLTLGVSSKHRYRVYARYLLRLVAQFQQLAVTTCVWNVLNSLMIRRQRNAAMQWLWFACKTPELQAVDTLPLWHHLLSSGAEWKDDHLIAACIKRMGEVTSAPTAETAKVIITALFRDPENRPPSQPNPLPSPTTMKHIIHLFDASSMQYDRTLADFIVREYTRHGQADFGMQMKRLYVTNSYPPDDGYTSQEIHEGVGSIPNRGYRAHFIRRCMDSGFEPTDATLVSAMGDDISPQNFAFWRELLGVQGSSEMRSKVIEHILQTSAHPGRDALQFYDSEMRSGFRPSNDMLFLALKGLLSTSFKVPSGKSLSKCLQLYREYVSRCCPPSPNGDEVATVRAPNRASVDTPKSTPPRSNVYQLLLRALTSNQDHLTDVVELVEDMKRFSVRIDPQLTASIILILMRSSPTPSEALQLYRRIGRVGEEGRPLLNEESYAAILHGFCSLKLWPQGIPSARQYFEIVADMRAQGIRVTAKVYTIILAQLAQLATVAKSAEDTEVVANIAKTITRVQNHLALNSEFTPDTPLWNQLMDAYQRAGCFPDALRVWQQLFASGSFNNASVSIILDACAFRNAYDVAVRIYTTLLDVRWPMNIRNWNTFLECLCRCDKLDEAMKVLCLEMTGRKDGVAPDVESLRIVLKFAARTNQEAEVRSKMKRFLPKLYRALSDELKTR